LNGYRKNTFSDRASESAKAKTALLEKFRSKPDPNDPEVQARVAEQIALAEARKIRTEERRRTREAEAIEKARLDKERAEEQKRLEAEAMRTRLEEARAAAAAAKAARDARYAARKARKK
jgi:hypothetical protein